MSNEIKKHDSIYGRFEDVLPKVLDDIKGRLERYNENERRKKGEAVYEHLICRIKTDESMREKCVRRGFPENTYSAIWELKDAVGIRIICAFRDDIYKIIEYIRTFSDARIIEEKDYIKRAKANGYRSYHLILEILEPFHDIEGNYPGHFFAEIQLRTIAMDSWASLEHRMKYKKNIKNQELIVSELKRCADELASLDISMQTIRNLINIGESNEDTISS